MRDRAEIETAVTAFARGIEPGEIEAALLSEAGVAQAAVVVREDVG